MTRSAVRDFRKRSAGDVSGVERSSHSHEVWRVAGLEGMKREEVVPRGV